MDLDRGQLGCNNGSFIWLGSILTWIIISWAFFPSKSIATFLVPYFNDDSPIRQTAHRPNSQFCFYDISWFHRPPPTPHPTPTAPPPSLPPSPHTHTHPRTESPRATCGLLFSRFWGSIVLIQWWLFAAAFCEWWYIHSLVNNTWLSLARKFSPLF